MRHYLKKLIITAASFYITFNLINTISIGADPKNIILVIGGLLVIFLIINPIFSLVLLPVNHLTFGLLMFVLNIALIFAFINFLPGFKVETYHFEGAYIQGFIVPPYSFNTVTTVILVAFIISLIQKILHIIFE